MATRKPLINSRVCICLLALSNAFTWSWLLLIDVARISNSITTGYLLVFSVFAVIVGISTASYWYAIKFLNKSIKNSKNWTIVLKIFFVWAFVELAVSWLLAVIWMGRNGNWSSTLPFSSLSPYLAWTPLGYASRIIGFYGLSALVVTGIFIVAYKILRRYIVPYFAIVVVLCIVFWGLYRNTIGLMVQATIVTEHLTHPTQVESGISKLIVLPEYGLDNYTNDNVGTRFVSNDKVFFVGSKQVKRINGFSNILVYGDNLKGYLKEEPKSRLVPGGEYLSLPVELLLRNFAPSTYLDFQTRRAVVRGTGNLSPYVFKEDIVVGGAACSSIISTEDYRDLSEQGATILTNSASLEIFRGSRLFNWQHRGLAKFMAVANARPFLQSSNNWPAFALDHNGNTLASVQPTGTKQVTIQTNNRKTPYTYLGEWVAILGGIYLAKELLTAKLYKKRATHESVK